MIITPWQHPNNSGRVSQKSAPTEASVAMPAGTKVSGVPLHRLKGNQMGAYTVRFKGEQADPKSSFSQEETRQLINLVKDFDPERRLQVLARLYKADKLTDNRLLRTLGRYVYFNDIYSTYGGGTVAAENLPGRILGLQTLSKSKSVWGIDGFQITTQEVGNGTIGDYATALFVKTYPLLPQWLKDRYRGKLYNQVINNSSYRTGAYRSALALGEIGDKTDLNYIWFRANRNPEQLVSEEWAHIFANVGYKQYGVDFFKALMEYKKQTPKQTEAERSIIISSLQEMPFIIARDPKNSRESALQKLPVLLDAYDFLTSENPDIWKYATIPSPAKTLLGVPYDTTGSLFALAIESLTTSLEDRDIPPLLLQLTDMLSSHPTNNTLLTLVAQLALNGQYPYETVHEAFTESLGPSKNQKYQNYVKWFLETVDDEPKRGIALLRADAEYSLKKDGASPSKTRQQPSWKIPDLMHVQRSMGPRVNANLEETLALDVKRTLEDPLVAEDISLKPIYTESPPDISVLEPFAEPSASPAPETLNKLKEDIAQAIADDNSYHLSDLLRPTVNRWLRESNRADYNTLLQFINDFKNTEFADALLTATEETIATRNKYYYRAEHVVLPKSKIPTNQILQLLLETVRHQSIPQRTATHLVKSLMSRVPEKQANMLQAVLTIWRDANAKGDDVKTEWANDALVSLSYSTGLPQWAFKDTSKLATELFDHSEPALKNLTNSLYSSVGLTTLGKVELAATLASKLGKNEFLDETIEQLYTFYNKVRDSAYSEETPLIRLLSHPEIIRQGVNTSNTEVFKKYMEMATWYQIFEAIPQMVKKAVAGPLDRESYIRSTIATMELYALPEIDEIRKTGTPEEKAFLEGLWQREILSPKTVFDTFYPFPGEIEILKYLPEKTTTPAVSSSSNSVPTKLNLRKVTFDDKSTSNPIQDNRSSQPGTTVVKSPSGLNLVPIRYMDDPQDQNLTEIQRMASLLRSIQSGNAISTIAAANDIAFWAKQLALREERNPGSVRLISPETTALVSGIAQQINRPIDASEKLAYLRTLQVIGNPEALQPLFIFLRRETENRFKIEALKALAGLTSTETEPVASLIEQANAPEDLVKQALTTLKSWKAGSDLLRIVKTKPLSEENERLAIEGIGAAAADGTEFTTEARAFLIEKLTQLEQNGAISLKEAAIKALGNAVEYQDPEGVDLLIRLTNNAPASIKVAVIQAIGTLERTQPVTQFLNQMSQDDDLVVRRVASVYLGNS